MDRTTMLSPGPGTGMAVALLAMASAGLLGLVGMSGWIAAWAVGLS